MKSISSTVVHILGLRPDVVTYICKRAAKPINKQPTRLKGSKSTSTERTAINNHRLPTGFDQKHTNKQQLTKQAQSLVAYLFPN